MHLVSTLLLVHTLTCIIPKLLTCKELEFSHVFLLAVLRGRISTGSILELSLLLMAKKINFLIINHVPSSIQIFISKFLNEVIPQPCPIRELLMFHDPLMNNFHSFVKPLSAILTNSKSHSVSLIAASSYRTHQG
jgi:hypothetical protein